MNTEHTAPRLHVPGLTETVSSMNAGGLYLIQLEQPELFYPWLGDTLLHNDAALILQQGMPVPLEGEARSRWRQGKLKLYRSELHAEFWPDLLAGLKQARLHGKSLLVFMGDQLGLQDSDGAFLPSRVIQLRAWCMQQGVTLLLLQRRDWAPSASTYLGAHELFSGMVRFDQLAGPWMWRVHHWSTPLAMQAGFRLELKQEKDACYLQPEMAVEAEITDSLDQGRVLACITATEDLLELPAGWITMPDNDAVLREAVPSGAASFLLAYDDNADFARLAGQIQTLRKQLGGAVRVAVREREGVLRHAQMALLRKVGCNLLVPRELPSSRVLTLLESMQNVQDTPFYKGDIQPLLLALRPLENRGYLPLPKFVESLLTLFNHAESVLEGVLVRLDLLPGVEPQQALMAMQMKRNGDVATADEDHVWIYFHGCQLAHVSTALEHVFELPMDILFSGQLRMSNPVDMQAQLEHLHARVSLERWQDYQPMLIQPQALAQTQAPGSPDPLFHPEPVAPAVAAPLQRKNRE